MAAMYTPILTPWRTSRVRSQLLPQRYALIFPSINTCMLRIFSQYICMHGLSVCMHVCMLLCYACKYQHFSLYFMVSFCWVSIQNDLIWFAPMRVKVKHRMLQTHLSNDVTTGRGPVIGRASNYRRGQGGVLVGPGADGGLPGRCQTVRAQAAW